MPSLSTSSLPSPSALQIPGPPLTPPWPRPPSLCSHLFPWKSHSFSLCWGHATGRGSQCKNSVTPHNPSWMAPAAPRGNPSSQCRRDQAGHNQPHHCWFHQAGEGCTQCPPPHPSHGAAHRASPNRDSPCLGLFSATQSPSNYACRAKGSRDTGDGMPPTLGREGRQPPAICWSYINTGGEAYRQDHGAHKSSHQPALLRELWWAEVEGEA